MPVAERDYMRTSESSQRSRARLFMWMLGIGGVLLVAVLLIRDEDSVSNQTPRARLSIDVNTASIEELDNLPNVSRSVAEAIIRGRPYKSVDEMIRVKGIGKATLEKIRPHVSLK